MDLWKAWLRAVTLTILFVLPVFPSNTALAQLAGSVSAMSETRSIPQRRASVLQDRCLTLVDRAAWASDWRCTAISANSGSDDRLSVPALRHRYENAPASLSAEERAILQAANRTGVIQFPDCMRPANNLKLIGSAFLVRVNGQDAVMTSGHLILDPETGAIRYGCTPDQFRRIIYFPNISYIDLKDAEEPDEGSPEMHSFEFDETEQFNLEELTQNEPDLDDRNDWVVFTLPRRVSEKRTLDGSVRGYVRMTSKPPVEGEVYNGFLVGLDPYFVSEKGGPATNYQRCKFEMANGRLRHACYTTPGSISALLGIMEDGEIRFVGMHNRKLGHRENSSDGSSTLNSAVSSSHIESTHDIRFDR